MYIYIYTYLKDDNPNTEMSKIKREKSLFVELCVHQIELSRGTTVAESMSLKCRTFYL